MPQQEVTSPQPAWAPKTRFEGKYFLFCAKVHLGHHGTTWNILHRASTNNYKGIGVNPPTLGRVHCSGKIGPTQPRSASTGYTRKKIENVILDFGGFTLNFGPLGLEPNWQLQQGS
jgi:hypothetical protein